MTVMPLSIQKMNLNFDVLKNHMGEYGANITKLVFNSNQIHTQWQEWLSQAFQSSQTHSALLYLLINGIKDPRFVDESIIYGKDLIKHAVVQDAVIDSSL